jgi:hypothetical protein
VTSWQFALPAALLLLAGCGSKPPPDAPEDVTLRQSARAGSSAMALERPAEAVTQYQRALERARARDDAGAIGDYGYNLAVAQLAADRPRDALQTVRTTRLELARRGVASFPALDLAEATALYRLGLKQESDRVAERVAAGNDPAAATRATFLRGLIADEAGNTAGLDAALARLAQTAPGAQSADADELRARHDLRLGALEAASTEAQRAADARRSELDYRGMVRALAVAADADARSGRTQAAADLYMRAGQSAAAQGDADAARRWMRQAMNFATDPGLRQTIRQAMAALPRPAPAAANR